MRGQCALSWAWALGGSSGFLVLGKLHPSPGEWYSITLIPSINHSVVPCSCQSHFMAEPKGPSAVGKTFQAFPKESETWLLRQHLLFRNPCLPFPLVWVAECKQRRWCMLYREALILFKLLVEGVCSPFTQLIREDFMGEVARIKEN